MHSWPGLLDCTVGGGLALNESPLECIIRESYEEASLPVDYVRKFVRLAGLVTFAHLSPAGLILPGVYYVYDLPLPIDGSIKPRKNDDEVEGFQLVSAQSACDMLFEQSFKASSLLGIVDFLVRHGLVTPITDPRYDSICLALRRDVGLPLPTA